MKKLLVVLLLVALALTFAACGEENSEIPAGMFEASDPDAVSYHLYVPQTWQVNYGTDGGEDSLKGWTMAQSAEGDRANVVVTYHSNSAIPLYKDPLQTLEEYYRGNASYEGIRAKLEALFDREPDPENPEATHTTFADGDLVALTVKKGEGEVPAYKVTYSGKVSGSEITQILVMIFDDDYFYNITLTAPTAMLDANSDLRAALDAIIGNFRLKG